MEERTPGPPTQRPPAGWYPDPVDPDRFRQWTGIGWTHVLFGGTLTRDNALIENLPLPNTFSAPEVPPGRSRRSTWTLLAGGVTLAFIVLIIATTETDSSSRGGSSLLSDEDNQAPATTVDPIKARCIDNALATDAVLVDQTIDASNSAGILDVNHAWSDLATRLAQIDLSTCPTEFRTAFRTYAGHIETYGAYLEDRTGPNVIDDIFNGDDVKTRRAEMLGEINQAYLTLGSNANGYGVDAPRGQLYLTD